MDDGVRKSLVYYNNQKLHLFTSHCHSAPTIKMFRPGLYLRFRDQPLANKIMVRTLWYFLQNKLPRRSGKCGQVQYSKKPKMVAI